MNLKNMKRIIRKALKKEKKRLKKENMSKIKIGDRVVHSPSLMPLVGEVVGIMGNYVTIRSEDGVVTTKPVDEYCRITDEELERYKKLKQEKEAQ